MCFDVDEGAEYYFTPKKYDNYRPNALHENAFSPPMTLSQTPRPLYRWKPETVLFLHI
jgi:hypothetical protein